MGRLRAVILDLDGVITRTAKVHAAAWKKLFDDYRLKRAARTGDPPYSEFDSERDYLQYVDGKPRQDGVKSFLLSRLISLPEGHPDDPPGKETCHGLANQKNRAFQEILRAEGPEVFEDAVRALEQWRDQGLKLAVASSSKNCEEVLKLARLTHFFAARVDGTHLQQWKMPGKPAPDMFLAAAEILGVDPAEAAVFEDAIPGVQAARAGNFGWVIGVARGHGTAEELRAAGADIVVTALNELDLTRMPGLRAATRPEQERGKAAES